MDKSRKAFGFVPPVFAQPGTKLHVMLLGAPREAVVLADSLYDPESLRPKTQA